MKDNNPRPRFFWSSAASWEDSQLLWKKAQASLAAGALYVSVPDLWTLQNGSDLSLVRLCVEKQIPVWGGLRPTGLDWEPYGELPYLELVNIYAHRALELRDAGVQGLVVEDALSLGEARAAVLGARQSGLPIHVTLAVDPDGESPQNTEPLASLVTLQGLGIQSFGFSSAGDWEDMLELAEKLAPYAHIPLTAKLPDLPPNLIGELTKLLLDRGISGFCCKPGTSPESLEVVKQLLQQDFPAPSQEEEEDSLLAACADQTFFLHEDMAYSQLLECSLDMADEVIAAEDDGCEILQIHIGSLDDAYHFGLNSDMMRLPVSLVADNGEALETALIYYSGRAIIDRLCDLDEEVLSALAKGYNALIL